MNLLVVDEAERLSPPALEHLRDRSDRRPLGLLLMGMPGTDTRLSRHRLVHRRFVQVERVLKIDDLTVITSDVVGAARSTLVIGDTQPRQSDATWRWR